jgi:ATP-dependent RNA helicase DeaD
VKIQTKTQTVTAIEQAHLLVHADQKIPAVLRCWKWKISTR